MTASLMGGFAAGAGMGAGSGLMNWALANKAADQQKSAIRHLRRREYKDMVFSLKQAGLNPILATGATPGHSAAAMVQPQSISMANDATRAASSALEADRQGTVIKKMGAEASAAEASGFKTDWERNREQAIFPYQLDQIKYLNFNTAANTDKLIQETDESIARTQAHWAEVAKTGVSAKEIAALTRAHELENVGRENTAEFRKTGFGRFMQNTGTTLGDIGKLVGPAVGFAGGVAASRRGGMSRNPPHSAQGTFNRTTRYDKYGDYSGHQETTQVPYGDR